MTDQKYPSKVTVPNPVVVFFTDDMNKAQDLIRSLDFFEWPYQPIVGKFKGWKDRLQSVISTGKDLEYSPYTHMIHVDAFDVLALRRNPLAAHKDLFEEIDPSDSKFKFKNKYYLFGDLFSHDLVISTEIGCWPSDSKQFAVYKQDYSGGEIPSPWRFPHSQFMVNLDSLRKLEAVGFGSLHGFDDDQLHMHWVWDNFCQYHSGCDIRLDNKCQLVQSIAFSHPWDSYFELNKSSDEKAIAFWNKLTKSLPFFAHGNGKTDMSWIKEKLETVYRSKQ